ncbi:hypothetical protein [Mycobacteroides abscessus]|uniref:hypothetical protein n=1 Tax=Mycobacteroides abscessus TaxID=36809 RepID=UPI0009D199EA|nr:hypothetical protein [Mycobacteroides abscessus]MBE5513713.1 hypothetical protein [Mycobacteroides abscessus]SLC90934.1 Uncharacterised protein [Mycobacteroides abscessus subsp. massiliense]SLE31478.1 Uncharacterised protein [Mycobacteroides abscessus subsp. massiliense]SLE58740.1 Uncharacterised protein [Mycobacteroides abscessus subsp. massiliense]
MITELRLVSNSGESTARFWSAVFNTPATDEGGGRWRIEPIAGPSVSISTARVVEAITRVDLTVTCDHAAADRLRALDFEVALDGSAAVDVNGTDATVYLVTRGWDGVSAVDREEPIPERPVRSDAYYEQLSDAVERGDYRVVGPVEIRGAEREQ